MVSSDSNFLKNFRLFQCFVVRTVMVDWLENLSILCMGYVVWYFDNFADCTGPRRPLNSNDGFR